MCKGHPTGPTMEGYGKGYTYIQVLSEVIDNVSDPHGTQPAPQRFPPDELALVLRLQSSLTDRPVADLGEVHQPELDVGPQDGIALPLPVELRPGGHAVEIQQELFVVDRRRRGSNSMLLNHFSPSHGMTNPYFRDDAHVLWEEVLRTEEPMIKDRHSQHTLKVCRILAIIGQ